MLKKDKERVVAELADRLRSAQSLIVTDYRIPGLDGRQLIEKLQQRANTSKVPVIILPSRADISEKLRMLQVSVEDYIEKPFYLKEATTRIKKVVDKIALLLGGR